MQELTKEWIGQYVSLTLRTGNPAAVALTGNLAKVSESGVMLELKNGRSFVPVSSILHITRTE